MTKKNIIRKIFNILLFTFLTTWSFAGNPAIRGNWKGYMISNSPDPDNKNGMPATLYIVDDNDDGDIVGEMTVQYRYQSDIYRAKYTIQGKINYEDYTIAIDQTGLKYYDLLPKGLNWCFATGELNIYRSSTAKKLYIDGNMTTNCGANLRMILIKM